MKITSRFESTDCGTYEKVSTNSHGNKKTFAVKLAYFRLSMGSLSDLVMELCNFATFSVEAKQFSASSPPPNYSAFINNIQKIETFSTRQQSLSSNLHLFFTAIPINVFYTAKYTKVFYFSVFTARCFRFTIINSLG